MKGVDFSDYARRAQLSIPKQLELLGKDIDCTKEYINNDGYICCLKCRTPKITIINYGDKELVVPCDCECVLEQRRIREQQEAEQKRQQIMEKRRSRSLLTGYERIKFDLTSLTSADKSFIEAYQRLQKYAEIQSVARSNGYGVYLWGECGTGKTHLAACLANRLLEKGCNVLFTNMLEVASKIRETFKSRYSNDKESTIIKELINTDFLFLDDFGTEKYMSNGDESWLQEEIYRVLDSRLTQHKPTIFTSNYPIKDLCVKRGLSVKNTDRVMALSTAVINIKGENYRIKSRKTELPF